MDLVLAGRYELEVLLGRGSSGEVWRGNDMATRRTVAIKLVELSLVDDATLLAESIDTFRREASLISGMRHPNMVGAVDAARIGNQLFMVMELAPGISLAAMMDERGARSMGLFPVSSVLRIAEQVCTGLAAAHAAGVVHRDIKPSNLMVTPSLGVKIIDFGIARLLADNAQWLMLPAQTVDTIAYMSPEQAQGLDVDGRGDLYSLGCVLYQLLTGHPPFFSTLPSALLMMQVMDRAVPLGNVRPDLPSEVCQLVSDLMEKEREARPADAQEVVSRIAALRETFGDEETEFEVDRPTIGAAALGMTRSEDFRSAQGGPTVLTPERMAQLSAPNAVIKGPGGPATGQPFGLSTPFQTPFQPALQAPLPAPFQAAPFEPRVPTQTSPARSVPQATARTGAATSTGASAPQWPAASVPPRRRSVWPGVIASFLTAAIVASVGAYYWLHTHAALKITKVAVAAADPRVGLGCNGTAHLIGTITTNDHSGPIDYEWVLNGGKKGVRSATADADSDTVQVTMAWSFRGKGTGQDVAQLDILTPQHEQASITFPYSCPR